MPDWTAVDRVAKDDQGRYQALMGGQWTPATKVAKNDQGAYMALMDAAPPPIEHVPGTNDIIPIGPGESRAPTLPQKDSLFEKLAGPGDAALTLLSSIPPAIIGQAVELFQNPEAAKAYMEKATRKPLTATGESIVDSISHAMQKLGVQALPGLGGELGVLARSTQGLGTGRGSKAVPPGAVKPAAALGADATEQAALRRANAASLPVPVKLTKGQAERTFEQQRFERETAKDPKAGQPLRERFAEQNDQILRNFDAWADQTGAQSPNLRAVGQSVDQALVNKAKEAKANIRAAYKKAEASGDMAQPVPYGALRKYLADQPVTVREKLAPILSAVEDQIKKSDPQGTGSITVNEMESIRQMINKNTEFGTPNYAHGVEVKRLIDQATDGAGGDLYKQARMMRTNFSREFTDRAAVAKLLRTKPGSADRSVAFEDVFQHSILDGSLDDMRAIRRTLQTAGPDGKQAWKELQGQTIKHLKEMATKSVQLDIKGNPIASASALDKAISQLDKDGKLDFLFGKQDAAKLRDINDLAKDVYTSPPGAINSSNTGSVIAALIDTTVSAVSGLHGVPIPVPIASGVKYLSGRLKDRKLNRRVQESLQ